MANIAIFRINYKSDFILTLNSDAGWLTPFCIKFWTGAPSQAYFAGYDGETYTHCAPVEGEPTKLVVQFDDHHLPIGDLKFQIGYHFTVTDFPTSVEDEVLNQASVIIEVNDAPAQVMLDLNGETAPEIEFSLPAYANEAQRIANEEDRIAAEQQRIANEDARIAAEETRQQNEQQRINQETARVNEFATLKSQSQAATRNANDAATRANQKAQLAADKAALADDAATLAIQKAQLAAEKAALANDAAQLANEKAALAQQKAEYAQQQGSYAKDQGDYAKDQGDYAKAQGDIAQSDHERAENDHGIAADDHTQAGNDHTRAEADHGIAADDHTQAGNDHTRAESDHGIAVDDHTLAGNDHTRAEADHGIAADDHTQAGNDHTRAESDHTRAESDHAAVEVYVDSLGAFDISAYHATGGVLAKYADLTAALGTNGANIPEALRKGGMSVKFVQGTAQSSDNKYVKFFCTADEFTTDVTQWQGVDDAPIPDSDNLVKSGGVYNKVNKIEKELGIPLINNLSEKETPNTDIKNQTPGLQGFNYAAKYDDLKTVSGIVCYVTGKTTANIVIIKLNVGIIETLISNQKLIAGENVIFFDSDIELNEGEYVGFQISSETQTTERNVFCYSFGGKGVITANNGTFIADYDISYYIFKLVRIDAADTIQKVNNLASSFAKVFKTNTSFEDFSLVASNGYWCNNFKTKYANGVIIKTALKDTIRVYIRTNGDETTYTLIKEYTVDAGVHTLYFDALVTLQENQYIAIKPTLVNNLYYVSSGGVGIIGIPGWEVSYWVFTYKVDVDGLQNELDSLDQRVSVIESTQSPLEQIQKACGLANGSISWLAIGDSFTEIDNGQSTGGRLTKGYMTRTCEQIPELICTNAGHSGATFGDAYSFSEITDGYDLYTILFGTNDFGLNVPLGTQEDFTNRVQGTILGNFGRLYQKVHDLAAGAPILVITSTACGVSENVYSGNPGHGDTQARSSDGLWKYQMQDAIIAACESENIPYVDAYHLSGISPKNTMRFARVLVDGVLTDLRYPDYLPYIDYSQRPETFLFPIEAVWCSYDGCHPSNLGMQIIADLIVPKIRELLFSKI